MVEVLVALLLLTIMLTGLVALQLTTIKTVTSSRRANEAVRLAQSLIEKYRTPSYANLPAAGGWVIELNDNNSQMKMVSVDGITTGPFTVERFVDDLNAGKEKLITVKVSWVDQANINQSVMLSLRRYL